MMNQRLGGGYLCLVELEQKAGAADFCLVIGGNAQKIH